MVSPSIKRFSEVLNLIILDQRNPQMIFFYFILFFIQED